MVLNPKGIPASSPRVARNELPWVDVEKISPYRNAVAAKRMFVISIEHIRSSEKRR